MKKLTSLIIILFQLSSCHYFKSETQYFEVTAKNGLILRKGPGQNFEKITTLPTKTSGKIIKFVGDTITIQGKTGRWIEVETGYLKGFIFSGFIIIHKKKVFSENNEKETQYDQYGIVNFTKSNKSSDELAEIFLNSYKLYEKELELKTKKISENNQYKISMFSLTSPKDQYTNYQSIVLLNKKNNSNFIPDGENFHLSIIAENYRIFYGNTYSCYECCAMPSNFVGFLTDDNVYAIDAPFEDTEAFCGVDGENNDDFSQLRITKSNDVIIHRISYECESNLECPNVESEGGCKPTKVILDQYILIKNPFTKPKTLRFHSKNVPENIISEFTNSRKPAINLELK